MKNDSPVTRVRRDFFKEPREGFITRQVEAYTARIPSLFYFNCAIASMALSAGLKLFTKKKDTAHFIGLWVPSLLLIGVYNKLVKIEGSDRFSRTPLH